MVDDSDGEVIIAQTLLEVFLPLFVSETPHLRPLVDVLSRDSACRCGPGRDPDEAVAEQISRDQVRDQDIERGQLPLIPQDLVVLEVQGQESLVQAIKDEEGFASCSQHLKRFRIREELMEQLHQTVVLLAYDWVQLTERKREEEGDVLILISFGPAQGKFLRTDSFTHSRYTLCEHSSDSLVLVGLGFEDVASFNGSFLRLYIVGPLLPDFMLLAEASPGSLDDVQLSVDLVQVDGISLICIALINGLELFLQGGFQFFPDRVVVSFCSKNASAKLINSTSFVCGSTFNLVSVHGYMDLNS